MNKYIERYNTPIEEAVIYVENINAENPNHGLGGAWVMLLDCNFDYDEVKKNIQNKVGGDESSWLIYDYNLHFVIDDDENIKEVCQRCLDIKNSCNSKAFAAYQGSIGKASTEQFEEAFVGEYVDESTFAEEHFKEHYLHEIPAHLRDYIDCEKYKLEIFETDFFSAKREPSGVFVFKKDPNGIVSKLREIYKEAINIIPDSDKYKKDFLVFFRKFMEDVANTDGFPFKDMSADDFSDIADGFMQLGFEHKILKKENKSIGKDSIQDLVSDQLYTAMQEIRDVKFDIERDNSVGLSV